MNFCFALEEEWQLHYRVSEFHPISKEKRCQKAENIGRHALLMIQ